MVQFTFIEKLFVKRQFEFIATEVFMKLYDCFGETNEVRGQFLWIRNSDGQDLYSPTDYSYIEFCKDKPDCKKSLQDNILENLFQEKIAAKEKINREALMDYKLSEKIRKQALSTIELFIIKFPSHPWLSDIPIILDELKSIREEIQNIPDNKEQFIEIDKSEVDKYHWKKLIKPELQNHLEDIEKKIETNISTWKDRNLLIECAAFCQLLYDKRYFVKGTTNRVSVNSFAKSKYGVDIEKQLESSKRNDRNTHKTLLLKYFK